jgi:thymidylate synthase ThyX
MINLLNAGYVRLVDHMGSDLSIVRAARVSYAADWRVGEDKGSDARLINYLWKNKHSTPFQAVTFTFEVKAPIFVIRQWHRHRTMCLSGDATVAFVRPCDGSQYQMKIRDLCRKWNHDPAVRRPDKQKRSLMQFNRDRIRSMGLYGVDGERNVVTSKIKDCWSSGFKTVYEVQVASGEKIKASDDHPFLTERGWVKLAELKAGDAVFMLSKSAPAKTSIKPILTEGDLATEEWRHTGLPGLSVSSLGRVRRYEKIVEPTTNNGGRSAAPAVITSITEAGEEETFDIEVEGDNHNFVANGFCVHNCYNEVSARYTELPEEYYVPDTDDITTQHTSNKQMRTASRHEHAEDIAQIIRYSCANANRMYRSLLAMGCPRELARGVLPVNQYSRMFVTVDLLNLLKFIGLRDHEHAQHEIKVYAQAMLELITPVVPVAVEAYKNGK